MKNTLELLCSTSEHIEKAQKILETIEEDDNKSAQVLEKLDNIIQQMNATVNQYLIKRNGLFKALVRLIQSIGSTKYTHGEVLLEIGANAVWLDGKLMRYSSHISIYHLNSPILYFCDSMIDTISAHLNESLPSLKEDLKILQGLQNTIVSLNDSNGSIPTA